MALDPGGAGAETLELRTIVDTFRARYQAGAPFSQDRALVDELALEVAPVAHALSFALGAADPTDVLSTEHREGLAMLSLLGRRLGTLGATPTAALAVLPALIEGFERAGRPIPAVLHEPLRAVYVEGYVAGREEHAASEVASRAVEAQPIVRIVAGCVVLFAGGNLEAEAIEQVVDRFGRAMFAANARSAVVDVEHLEGPDRSRAAELFGADATARMLGATCVFSAVSPEWLEAARTARVPTELLALEPTFELAVRRALAVAGYELRTARSLASRLREAFARRGSPRR